MNSTAFFRSVFVLPLLSVFFLLAPAFASANTLNVGQSQTYTTIQSAIDAASNGDTINVAAGTYDAFSVVDKTNLTIAGAGAGSTIIKPTTLINTGVGHKYTANMQVSVFVNGSAGITIGGMSIEDNGSTPGAGGPDALVFWNASTGSINNIAVTGTYPINGVQTGQGIAVDAGLHQTTNLTVTNAVISGTQKNGYDIEDGNRQTSGNAGTITVDIENGSITGAGPTGAIAQNGVVAWNLGGGTVTARVNGTAISNLEYTGSGAAADGILAYGTASITPISNASFTNTQLYIQNAIGGSAIDATTGNTFDSVSPAGAIGVQLAGIENKLSGVMEDSTAQPIYILPNTLIVTTTNRGVQAAVNAASIGQTVLVTPGTYNENVNINKPLTLAGAQAGIAGASAGAVQRSGSESVVNGMNITANNVTVNGFTFNNIGTQVTVTGSTGSSLSGDIVEDNIFNGYKGVGLVPAYAGVFIVNGNLFENPAGASEAMQFHSNSATGGCSGSLVINNVFVAAVNNGGADVNFSCTDSNSSNVTVSGNVEKNNTGGSSFVAFSGITGGISITNNTVSTSGSSIFFFGDVSGAATISGNHITNGASNAISIHGGDNLGTDDPSNTGTFTITNNVLSGNGRGIYVVPGAVASGAQVAAHGNDFSGNTTAGIENAFESTADTALAVDASGNWWGSASGPTDVVSGDGSTPDVNAAGTGSSAVGAVNYGPWCYTSDCSVSSSNPGTLQITKYECPAGTAVTRALNGVGKTVPAGCVPGSGTYFGYVHGWQTDAHSPYPELGQPFTLAGSTGADGILSISLPSDGRYLVAETDASGNQLPANAPLGLYCTGDGDTSGTNDNQELTFLTPGGTDQCIAYDPMVLTAPTNLTPADGTITNDPAFNDTWSPVTGAAGYQYETSYTSDGTNLGAIIYSDSTATTPGNYDMSGSPVIRHNGGTPDATYYWHVRAVDGLGNPGPWSVIQKVTIDNTAPTATFIFPVAGPAATSFQVQFNKPVNESDATNPANYYLNNWPGAGGSGPLTGEATVTYDSGSNIATVTFTQPGWYVSPEQQWGVTGIHDLANNLISPNPTTSYSTPLVAPTAPGAPTTATPTIATTQVWTWPAATDPTNSTNASGVASYWYEITDNNSNAVLTAWTNVGSALGVTTNLPVGAYTLHVEASDNAGNIGPQSTGTVTITAVTPPAPTPSVTTNAAQNITASDATLEALNGGIDAQGHSFWISTTPHIDTSTTNMPSGVYSTPDMGAVLANTGFTAQLALATTQGVPGNMPAVQPNTTYYYVAWVNVGGTWYPGAEQSFETLNGSAPLTPSVTTGAPTAQSMTDATLNGQNGSVVADAESFWVSQDSSFDLSNPNNIPADAVSTQVITDPAAIAAGGAFSASLSSVTNNGIPNAQDLPAITSGTTYYYVAWSHINGQWYHGDITPVTTLAAPETAPVISNEHLAVNSQTSVTITWTTDHTSTSRVVYGTTPQADNTMSVCQSTPGGISYSCYGYSNSTDESDTPADTNGQISHSVTITGLVPGTTYYFRPVSEGSPESAGDELTYDVTPPTITLKGDNTAYIKLNALFSDPGVTVTDNVSTNLGYLASIDGGASTTDATPTLDTSKEGTYTIFYSAKDNAGNATSTSRTVIVDGTAPTATITSTSADPTTDNPIHMTVTFSEPITGFGQGALTLTGAVPSNFAASSTNPLVYTFDLIPTASDVVVIIQAGTYQDLAGNQNIENAGSDFEITYSPLLPPSTPAPTVTQSVSSGGGGVMGGPFSVGFNNSGVVLGTSTENTSTGVVTGNEPLPTGCNALLTEYLGADKKNDPAQVRLLQTFLNGNLGTTMPISGFFGSMTTSAVDQFQLKYKDIILTPWGLTQPTGYVYKFTEYEINLLSCSTLNAPVPSIH